MSKKEKPYLEADGNLVIPFNSDPRYHWWNGGQSISETTNEIKGGKDSETKDREQLNNTPEEV